MLWFRFFMDACCWALATTNVALLVVFFTADVFICSWHNVLPKVYTHTHTYTNVQKNLYNFPLGPTASESCTFLRLCGCPLIFCIPFFAVCTKFLFNIFSAYFACVFCFVVNFCELPQLRIQVLENTLWLRATESDLGFKHWDMSLFRAFVALFCLSLLPFLAVKGSNLISKATPSRFPESYVVFLPAPFIFIYTI